MKYAASFFPIWEITLKILSLIHPHVFKREFIFSHFPDGVTESRVRRSLAQRPRTTGGVSGGAEKEFLFPTSQSVATWE